MRKLLWIFLAFLFLAGVAHGQGVRFGDGQPIFSAQVSGGPVYSVPLATISFCGFPANAVPCTNKAITYTDITLATPCASNKQITLAGTANCVTTTDLFGNWGVWVAAGNYSYTIQLPGGGYLGPYAVTLSSSGGGGGFAPASPGLSAQFSNAGVTAFASAPLTVDSLGSPTTLNWTKKFQAQNGVNIFTDTGAANAYVITTPFAISSLVSNMWWIFKATNANTGASTLTVDSASACTITKNGGSGGSSALIANDIKAGQEVMVSFDGTNCEMLSLLGNPATGSITNPAGSDKQIQFNASGAFGANSGIAVDNSTSPTKLNVGLTLNVTGESILSDTESCGVNPWVDIRCFGASSTAIHTTGTGSSTSLTVGVSTFANGNGIDIAGGGAAPSMSTPSAPTVAPGETESLTVTDAFWAAGTLGASSYSYCILAEDSAGGVTQCSPTTTNNLGPATLGKTTVTLSAISLTGQTLSFTSSGNHGLIQYAKAHITAGSNSFYLSGWFNIQTITDNTHASATNTIENSGTSTITAASGTLVYFTGNQVSFSTVAGAYRYWVCAKRPGDGALHIIGTALPNATTFVDYGFNLNQTVPWYMSDSNCTAGAAQPKVSVNKVTAGGGTTALTLNSALGTAVTGAAVRLSNGLAMSAAATAADQQTMVYIPGGPFGAFSFEFNDPTYNFGGLASDFGILQAGQITANGTIILPNNVQWGGLYYKGYGGSFSFDASAPSLITCNANPCLDLYTQSTSAVTFYNIGIKGSDNGVLASVGVAFSNRFDNVKFQTGTDNNDNMGIALFAPIAMPQTDECDHCAFSGGPNQNIDQTWGPLVYVEGNNVQGGGSMNFQSPIMNRRGIYFKQLGGSAGSIFATGLYNQGNITPLVEFDNASGAVQVTADLSYIRSDSAQQAFLVCGGANGASVSMQYHFGITDGPQNDGGGNPNIVSGSGCTGSAEIVGSQIGNGGIGFKSNGQSLSVVNAVSILPSAANTNTLGSAALPFNSISVTSSTSNIACPFSIKSGNYTLTANDCIVAFNSAATVTVPHASTGYRWTIMNLTSGSIVTIQADSGNVIAAGLSASTFALTANTSTAAVTPDGTNVSVSVGGGGGSNANCSIAGPFGFYATPGTTISCDTNLSDVNSYIVSKEPVDVTSQPLAVEANTAGAAYNVGNLACVTASDTFGDCPSAAQNQNSFGVIRAKDGSLPVVAVIGETTLANSNASVVWTANDIVCTDATNAAKMVDNAAVYCAPPQVQVGFVLHTDAGATTSHTIVLARANASPSLPLTNTGTNILSCTLTSVAQGQVLGFNSTPICVNLYPGVNVNAQTGSYTILCPQDRFGEVDFNLTTDSTATIPQAGSNACFQSNFGVLLRNAISSTGRLTVAPTTSTFQPENVSTYVIPPGGAIFIYSDAVSSTGNYHAIVHLPLPSTFGALTDGATVTWNTQANPTANASLTFTVHGGSRALNVTNMVNGGSYTLFVTQDATGGEGLTLVNGCNGGAFKVIAGGGGLVTLSSTANALDVLTWTFNGTFCALTYGKNFN